MAKTKKPNGHAPVDGLPGGLELIIEGAAPSNPDSVIANEKAMELGRFQDRRRTRADVALLTLKPGMSWVLCVKWHPLGETRRGEHYNRQTAWLPAWRIDRAMHGKTEYLKGRRFMGGLTPPMLAGLEDAFGRLTSNDTLHGYLGKKSPRVTVLENIPAIHQAHGRFDMMSLKLHGTWLGSGYRYHNPGGRDVVLPPAPLPGETKTHQQKEKANGQSETTPA